MSLMPVIEIAGKRYVLVAEAEYERLVESVGDPLPPLPAADAAGYRPALPFVDATIARDIIRERRAAGLSQQQLADAAGVRQETLSRIESGRHSPNLRTLKKIEKVLQQAPRRKKTAKLQVVR